MRRPLTQKAKYEIENDPFYKRCIRSLEGTCQGRITIEHALYYAGQRIDDPFALVPLCAYHHEVDGFQDKGDLDKEYGQHIALSRATEEDLAKYPRENWKQKKAYLAKKYADTPPLC